MAMAMAMEKISPNFPMELFLKLPLKSLLRFKSVSKLWQSIITNSEFSKLRFRSGNKLFIKSGICQYFSADYEKLIMENCLDDDQAIEVILQIPRGILDSQECFFHVIGSCNGLICFMNYEGEINIWNPSAGNSKILPKSSIYSEKNCGYSCGFGYDKSIDDHKLVVMAYNELEKKTNIEVLSLKTNSWRKIDQDFNYGKWHPFRGTLFNGALHWLGYSSSSSSSDPNENRLVVAFDLEQEKFQVFSQPFLSKQFCASFAVIGGCLCLYYMEINDEKFRTDRTDIWIMKEYGVESSWAKLCTIPKGFKPLCFSKDGQMIGIVDNIGPVVSCDIKENNLQLVSFYKPSFITMETLYEESLVWPVSEHN